MHLVARHGTLWGGFDTAAYARAAVDTVLALDPAPDLVLVSGDLTDDGQPESYEHFVEVFERLGHRLLVIPGNHDDVDALRAGLPGAWLAGGGGVDGVVELGGVRLVCLDSVSPPGADGDLTAAQLDWLDGVLADDRSPAIVALHHPPYETGIEFMDEIGLAVEASFGLAAVVARHPHVARVVGGHVHRLVVCDFAGTVAVLAPSVTNAVFLDLGARSEGAWTHEPPGLLLHDWSETRGLVTHLLPVGDYPATAF